MAESKYKSVEEQKRENKELLAEPSVAKPKKKEPEEDSKYPPWDVRYEVSLATEKDQKVYKKVHETNKLEEAKKTTISLAEEKGRECILWDNRDNSIIFRHKPIKEDDGTEKEAEDVQQSAAKKPQPKYPPKRR